MVGGAGLAELTVLYEQERGLPRGGRRRGPYCRGVWSFTTRDANNGRLQTIPNETCIYVCESRRLYEGCVRNSERVSWRSRHLQHREEGLAGPARRARVLDILHDAARREASSAPDHCGKPYARGVQWCGAW